MISVSVIIPTYNRAQKVVKAISSVLRQTFDNFEIFVVDDGSTDETGDLLTQFRHDIITLSNPNNLGVSAARNKGLNASEAPFIAFLDSDDYWLPEKLEVQMEFFKQHPDAVACQTEEIWIRKGRRVNPRKKHLKPSGDIFKASLGLCLVSPSAAMLKRSVLDKVGYFDQDFPVCEDYDLWLRISCRYPIYLINRHLTVKEGGAKDQLSTSMKGMDRFRIKALVKLLKRNPLKEDQRRATLRELTRKCRIYGQGCLKRGKMKEGTFYLQLPEKIEAELSKRLL